MRRSLLPSALLGLSALLGACTDPVTAPPVTTLTLQGKATGVSFPNGRVHLASGNEVNLDTAGTMSAPDTFSISMTIPPATETAFDMLSVPNCTFSGAATARPKIHFYDRLKVTTTDGDPMGNIREAITVGASLPLGYPAQVAYVYSDRAASVRGTLTCGVAAKVEYGVALRAGWNRVEYGIASNSASMKTLGSGVQSEFRSELNLPRVGAILTPSVLTFTDNAVVEVSATFFQDGGYNGVFTLSTDIEGLTVEPATVTLSDVYELGLGRRTVLGSLGLGAQALRTGLTFRYTGSENGLRPFVLSLSDDFGNDAGRGDGMLDVQRP